MLHSQTNPSVYHEQQHQQHHQHQHQHQHQYQREDMEYQSSPPTSSAPSTSHRVMNPYTQQSSSALGATNNNTHYRSHTSQQQQQQQHMHAHQQQQQQHSHHRHQHSSYVQQAYQSSQIHLPHYASAKREDHHTTQQHSIPVIESSDPSFSQRPHSRSFSSTHPHPQYQPPNPPHHPPPPPQQHPQHQHQHQPRLHHSVSAGHLSAAGHRSTPIVSNTGYVVPKQGTGTVVPPKKKDPYATAWRTYSKIAEELNLLNPDGSLYPISKEAILKYLRHQSKRIKASNLHWYVNGLKKHQENLGFSWDDVRYDEQVLALLKELTLHPAPIENNGVNHQYYKTSLSGPIDTARIASLSISDAPHSKHFAQQQSQHQQPSPQQQPHSRQQQQQPFQQPSSHPTQFTTGAKRQPSHPQQYNDPPSQQQSRQYHQYPSQRTQPQPPSSSTRAAPYHSAPVQLPSQHVQDEQMSPESSLHRHRSHSNAVSRAHASQSTSSGLDLQSAHPVASTGSNIKRKRHELGSERIAHIGSPASAEGEPYEDSETGSRAVDQDDRGSQNAEDMEEEDPCERVALKRHASTGTLRSQARAMSIISSDAHPMPRQDISGREFPVSTPSPSARENDVGEGSHFRWGTSETVQSRLSPSGSVSSVGSNSPVIRHAQGGSILSSQRHRRANGVVSSPISTVVAAIAAAANGGAHASATTPLPAVPNKNTVQFSEVVEYAQQLQTKYGSRCKDHPWGCVELTEDHHIELTIKMYMDWAGLVASGRLTMDELPDLPEFKRADVMRQDGSSPYSPPLSTSPSSSSSPVPSSTIGGTLKRMTSSPLTTSFSSFSLSQQQQQRQRQISGNGSSFSLKTEDPSSPIDSPDSTSRFTFGGQHRSPSSSPAPFGESLMSRLGSPPPHHGSQRGKTMSPEGGNIDDLVSAGGNHAVSLSSSSSYVSRVRARKIASSPSLGQHSSFHPKQRSYNGSGPSSPPPVPALPASLLHSDMHMSQKNGHARSIMSNSTASPPPSEEMDLSADEEISSRTRIVMADQEHRHPGRDNVPERGSEGIEMSDNFMEEDAFQENTRFNLNLRDEEADYDEDQWQRREPLEGKNRRWNAYSNNRSSHVEREDELEERGQEDVAQGKGEDEEESHRVRMKSLEPSSSPSRRDANGLMNSDPISTVAMDMMPNLQPRSQQHQHHHQKQHNHRAQSPQRRSSRHEQAMESSEDIAMMET